MGESGVRRLKNTVKGCPKVGFDLEHNDRENFVRDVREGLYCHQCHVWFSPPPIRGPSASRGCRFTDLRLEIVIQNVSALNHPSKWPIEICLRRREWFGWFHYLSGCARPNPFLNGSGS
jgi:hypothetical protein